MELLQDLDIVALTTGSLIVLAIALVLILWSLKRYELALIVILVSPCIHWLSTPSYDFDVDLTKTEPLTIVRLGLVALAGTAGLLFYLRSMLRTEESVPTSLKLLGIFLLYALISTSYSLDVKFTFSRSAEFTAFFAFLLGLYSWMDSEERVRKVFIITCALMCFYVVANASAIALLPDRAWYPVMTDRLQGLTDQPNSLGGLCLIAYPFLMWMFARAEAAPLRAFAIAMILVTLIVHVMTGSRSSLAASAVAFVLWPLLMKRHLLAIAMILVLLSGGAFMLLHKPASLNREASTNITDLTGRTDFWKGCLMLIKEEPVLGYGYGVEGKVWDDPRFQSNAMLWSGSSKASLHNGYLSILVGLGLTGFIIWMALILIPLARFMRLPSDINKACVIVLIMECLVLNMFESSFGGSSTLGPLVLMLSLVVGLRLTSLSARQEGYTDDYSLAQQLPKVLPTA